MISLSSPNNFIDNDFVTDAVIKNILVIRETTKSIPRHFRDAHPQVEWGKLASMRDVVQHKIPTLKEEIKNSFHPDITK